MITQIEIDGFKTFKDFKVELAPFQVIVGPNGSGKSNLFDALQLLSALAETDLYSAFQKVRGPGELFTKYADGSSSDRIRIAVELVLDQKVRDTFGIETELVHRRWRYEVEIAQRVGDQGLEELSIEQELLKAIPLENDTWCKKYAPHLLAEGSLLAIPSDNFLFAFKDKSLSVNHQIPPQMVTQHEHILLKSLSEGIASRPHESVADSTILGRIGTLLTISLAVQLLFQFLSNARFKMYCISMDVLI